MAPILEHNLKDVPKCVQDVMMIQIKLLDAGVTMKVSIKELANFEGNDPELNYGIHKLFTRYEVL